MRQILFQKNNRDHTTIKKSWEWLKRGIRVSAVCLAFYGWWGMIYPELTLLPSTYDIVYDEIEETEEIEDTDDRTSGRTVQNRPEVIEWNSDNRIYWKLIEAAPGQIRYKSRLLELIGAGDHSTD